MRKLRRGKRRRRESRVEGKERMGEREKERGEEERKMRGNGQEEENAAQ